MDHDHVKSEIVRLIKESAKPRRNHPRSPPPKITVTGNNNVIALSSEVKVEQRRDSPTTKRKPERPWREELSGLISARAFELGLSSDQVIELATKKIGRQVSSLSNLSARDLGRLYELIVSLKRPALE